MTGLTRAEELHQRASVCRDVAHAVRWEHPVENRTLLAVAAELDEIARNLNPEARSAT